MHDTDAAGRIYFANLLRIAHEAFEAFMHSIKWDIGMLLKEGDFLFPVVHVEADYTEPLSVGDELTVEVTVGRIGETSCTLLYRFIKKGKHAAGSAQIIHVTVNKQTNKPCPIPDQLRRDLEKQL